jgi:hypothetical protein
MVLIFRRLHTFWLLIHVCAWGKSKKYYDWEEAIAALSLTGKKTLAADFLLAIFSFLE